MSNLDQFVQNNLDILLVIKQDHMPRIRLHKESNSEFKNRFDWNGVLEINELEYKVLRNPIDPTLETLGNSEEFIIELFHKEEFIIRSSSFKGFKIAEDCLIEKFLCSSKYRELNDNFSGRYDSIQVNRVVPIIKNLCELTKTELTEKELNDLVIRLFFSKHNQINFKSNTNDSTRN